MAPQLSGEGLFFFNFVLQAAAFSGSFFDTNGAVAV